MYTGGYMVLGLRYFIIRGVRSQPRTYKDGRKIIYLPDRDI